MLNRLLLNSGNDIPFEEANLIFHPPTIKEIGYIGETNLWHGVEFLNFSKNILEEKDKSDLTSISDFEILMSIVNNDNINAQIHFAQMEMVLGLLFPNYHFTTTPQSFIFIETVDKEKITHLIDKDNFDEFKKYIQAIFCLDQLKDSKGERKYNPSGSMAAALVEKFKARRKKLAEIKKKNGQDDGLNILDIYVSTLSVGLKKDKNKLMNYTVYQLFDEYHRFMLEYSYDLNMKVRLAGATKIKEAENWMGDIYNVSDDKN